MPNVLIQEACIVVTPSNEAVHAKVGEIFAVNPDDAGALVGQGRAVLTKAAPYRIPDEEPKAKK
jgi:hypothetical protein